MNENEAFQWKKERKRESGGVEWSGDCEWAHRKMYSGQYSFVLLRVSISFDIWSIDRCSLQLKFSFLVTILAQNLFTNRNQSEPKQKSETHHTHTHWDTTPYWIGAMAKKIIQFNSVCFCVRAFSCSFRRISSIAFSNFDAKGCGRTHTTRKKHNKYKLLNFN